MKTLIVTGGAGFIGSNFVRLCLSSTDLRVVIVDKLTYAGNKASISDLLSTHRSRVSFFKADIGDGAALRKIFAASKPNGVVNFAAETHVDRSIDGPAAFVQTNVVGTFRLLEASREYLGKKKGRDFCFVHVSTDEVFGSLGPEGKFSETSPYQPNSPYSASKAASDHFVRAYNRTYGFPAIVTNCGNNYGPYQFPEKLIPLMILNAMEAKPLPIYGDGGNVRDWIYVEDHCAAILSAFEAGRPGETYNIGSDTELSNLQVVDTVCRVLNEIHPAVSNPAMKKKGLRRYDELKTFVQDRPGHDRRYAMDCSKIRDEFGWAPKESFEKGLRKTVRWYLDHPAWRKAVQSGKYRRERLGLKGAKKK